MAMSCTISQPTVIRPRSVSISRRSCRSRSSTTVLATESATPKMSPAPERPAEPPANRHAERRGDQALRQRPRDSDGANRQQILEREMQPHAEHQENDADLGELVGDVLVGDKARRERPDDDAGHEIADQRRQLEAIAQATPKAKASTRPIAMVETSGGTCGMSEPSANAGHKRGRVATRPGSRLHPDNEWRRRQSLSSPQAAPQFGKPR